MAAQFMCDMHIPKMVVESAQMMASALRRHGAEDKDMPKTKAGKPWIGGYPYHPCTRWAGECRPNYVWLMQHAVELCREFRKRFGKVHSCTLPIFHMCDKSDMIPSDMLSRRTEFVQAMPDEYKNKCPVKAYRTYYVHEKKFAEWNRGTPQPLWWITRNQIINENRSKAQAY